MSRNRPINRGESSTGSVRETQASTHKGLRGSATVPVGELTGQVDTHGSSVDSDGTPEGT